MPAHPNRCALNSIRQIRLYYKGCNQHTYGLFDTERLAEDENHRKRFVFLLGAERVVPPVAPCHLVVLLGESEKVGRDLTKGFVVALSIPDPTQSQRACANNNTQRLIDITTNQHAVCREFLDRLRIEYEISDLVNAAYGLTPDEIALMWATAPPRMPISGPRPLNHEVVPPRSPG